MTHAIHMGIVRFFSLSLVQFTDLMLSMAAFLFITFALLIYDLENYIISLDSWSHGCRHPNLSITQLRPSSCSTTRSSTSQEADWQYDQNTSLVSWPKRGKENTDETFMKDVVSLTVLQCLVLIGRVCLSGHHACWLAMKVCFSQWLSNSKLTMRWWYRWNFLSCKNKP